MTVRVRLEVMDPADVDAWRADRAAAGTPLPGSSGTGRWEALEIVVDDVAVGGTVLTYTTEDGRSRAAVRVMQTTLPTDAGPVWAAVLAAVEQHVRRHGVTLLTTAVAPDLAAPFQAAGFRATMTAVTKRLDPGSAPELQEDRRVAVRPMTDDERRTFAAEVREVLRAGMERAGVLPQPGAAMAEVEERLARLAQDPPPAEELLMTGLVDGEPVGRAWATLVHRDGTVDFLGNTIDLFPQYRGLGLTKSFLGALRRHVQTIGVRDVHLNVYGHDHGARRTFLDEGAGVADVYLRKDLRQDRR